MIQEEKVVLSVRLNAETEMGKIAKKSYFKRRQNVSIVEKRLFYYTYWHICLRTVIKQMLRADKVYIRCVLVDGIEGSAGLAPALPEYSDFTQLNGIVVLNPKIDRDAAIEKAKASIKDLILRKVFLLKDLDFHVESVKLVHSPYWQLTLTNTKGEIDTCTVNSVSGCEDRRVGFYYKKYAE
jgi:hypothetical protein